MRIKYICPLIVVEDMEKSKKFYIDLLEQKVKYDFGENIVFEGDFSIHLKEHYQKLLGDKIITKKSNSFELYFETEDINKISDKLKNSNIVFVHEIEEQPWAQRVIRFYDPDFHIIEIGETLESVARRLHQNGFSIEDICKKISMPEDFVRSALKNEL